MLCLCRPAANVAGLSCEIGLADPPYGDYAEPDAYAWTRSFTQSVPGADPAEGHGVPYPQDDMFGTGIDHTGLTKIDWTPLATTARIELEPPKDEPTLPKTSCHWPSGDHLEPPVEMRLTAPETYSDEALSGPSSADPAQTRVIEPSSGAIYDQDDRSCDQRVISTEERDPDVGGDQASSLISSKASYPPVPLAGRTGSFSRRQIQVHPGAAEADETLQSVTSSISGDGLTSKAIGTHDLEPVPVDTILPRVDLRARSHSTLSQTPSSTADITSAEPKSGRSADMTEEDKKARGRGSWNIVKSSLPSTTVKDEAPRLSHRDSEDSDNERKRSKKTGHPHEALSSARHSDGDKRRRPSNAKDDRSDGHEKRKHNQFRFTVTQEIQKTIEKRALEAKQARTGLLSPVGGARSTPWSPMARAAVSAPQKAEVEDLVNSYVELVCEDFQKKG
jgi:hypothetical protein